METDASQLVMSLEQIARIAQPGGWPAFFGELYIFRSDWNTTGSRFVTHLRSSQGDFGAKAYIIRADASKSAGTLRCRRVPPENPEEF